MPMRATTKQALDEYEMAILRCTWYAKMPGDALIAASS